MDVGEYQERSLTTTIYPAQHKIVYPALGLYCEVADKI